MIEKITSFPKTVWIIMPEPCDVEVYKQDKRGFYLYRFKNLSYVWENCDPNYPLALEEMYETEIEATQAHLDNYKRQLKSYAGRFKRLREDKKVTKIRIAEWERELADLKANQ
jgi:hypothetical protein